MDTSIAANCLCLGALPARHARYRPRHAAVIIAARSPRERELRSPFWPVQEPAL